METDQLDILTTLSHFDLEHVIFAILGQLSALDLRCCQLVSSSWNYWVQSFIRRHEKKLLLSWEQGQPSAFSLQCEKQRSTCTITSLSVDELGLCVGLGSSGDLEFWDRRTHQRIWRCHAHDDGVYVL